MRRSILVVLLAVAALGALGLFAPAAGASPYVRYGIQDDAWLEYGPGSVAERVDTVHELGATVVRVTLDWSQIQPRRGHFDWSSPDALLTELHRRGIAALVTLYGTPRWANGGRSENWAPTRGSAFAAFARTAARRYRYVRLWTIWNEPNQVRSLRPASPAVYTTRLLNPAYTAIHGVQAGEKVAGGVTAPRGGTGGVSPVAWIQGMHAAHAKLDAYAHNPYPLSPRETPFAGGCDHCTTVTLATLERLERIVAADFPRARMWLTEYGYQTNPPDRVLGVSDLAQARFLGEAALRAYELPRVDILIHYLLQDEPDVDRWQSGLLTVAAKPKPAYDAFRLPLAERSRTGLRTVLWGQVRPGHGRRAYRLLQERNGGWRSVGATRRTGAGGMFQVTVRAGKGARLRVWLPAEHVFSPTVRVS
jgi:hypothetical protein